MTTRIDFIIGHLRADRAAILSEPEPPKPPTTAFAAYQQWHHDREAWRERRELAEQGIVPISLSAWLGREPTHSETTLFARCYGEGERRGLWRRVRSDGGRTWALELADIDSDEPTDAPTGRPRRTPAELIEFLEDHDRDDDPLVDRLRGLSDWPDDADLLRQAANLERAVKRLTEA